MLVYVASQALFSVALVVIPGKKKLGFFGPDIPYNAYHSKPVALDQLCLYWAYSQFALSAL